MVNSNQKLYKRKSQDLRTVMSGLDYPHVQLGH